MSSAAGQRMRMRALLPLLVALASAEPLTTYSGYLIDLYCLGLVRGGGRALDGTDILRAPWTHSLHCLRDPSQCRDGGYYLAWREENGEYRIQFTFDDAGNRAVLALLDSDRRSSNGDGNFLVTAVGVHEGDGVLRGVDLSLCSDGMASCDSICDGNCTVPEQDVELEPTNLLVAHAVFMLLGWGFLLPAGVIWARALRQSKAEYEGKPLWFAGHRIIQMLGWFFQLVGFGFIFAHKEQGGGELATHFNHRHEILGLVVVILGSLQPLNAQIRHLSFIGHAEDGNRSAARVAWEWLHKGQGYVAVLLGVVNVILGIVYANDLGFSNSFVTGTIVGAALFFGVLLLAAIVSEARRLLQPGDGTNGRDEAKSQARGARPAGP